MMRSKSLKAHKSGFKLAEMESYEKGRIVGMTVVYIYEAAGMDGN